MRRANDAARYVDSETVLYISVLRELRETHGVQLGDVCIVEFAGNRCSAVVVDVGPRGKYGGQHRSGSRARHRVEPEARRCSKGVTFYVFAGSSKGWPRSNEHVTEQDQ